MGFRWLLYRLLRYGCDAGCYGAGIWVGVSAGEFGVFVVGCGLTRVLVHGLVVCGCFSGLLVLLISCGLV